MVFNLMRDGALLRIRPIGSGLLVMRKASAGWGFAPVSDLDLLADSDVMHVISAVLGGWRCVLFHHRHVRSGGEILTCLPWRYAEGHWGKVLPEDDGHGFTVLHVREGWIDLAHHVALPGEDQDTALARISTQTRPPRTYTSNRRHPLPPCVPPADLPDVRPDVLALWMQNPARYDRQRAAELLAQARSAA